ncbi:MAG: putative cytokinetic ring protein SteA [Actinomycetes bacterium]
MRMPTLRRPAPSPPLPGLTGPARVGREPHEVVARVQPGDIAVLDHLDLDRATAQALLDRGVVAVVNASPSTSGRYPNLGPETLVRAGVPLLDGVGADVLHRVRDGEAVRLVGASLYDGDTVVAVGTTQTADSVEHAMTRARAGLSAQIGSLVGDAGDRLRRDGDQLLDGVGVPPLQTPLAGRPVLLVVDGPDTDAHLRWLRSWVRDQRPVLLAVGAGADRALDRRLVPDVVLADLDTLSEAALTCGAEMVALTLLRPGPPAAGRGQARPGGADDDIPALGRAYARGVRPVPFPTGLGGEDAALLLASCHGARLVVRTGAGDSLLDRLDRGREGAATAVLTRLCAGDRVLHAEVVAGTYRPRISTTALALLVASALAAMVAALLVSPVAVMSADEVARLAESAASVLRDLGGGSR